MKTLPPQVVSLIHYVELSNAGWWEATIDRCVLASLWLISEPAPPNKIRKEIERQLDLDLKASEVESSLQRLENREVVRLGDGRYKLSIEAVQELKYKVDETNQLEENVRQKFVTSIQNACPDLDPTKFWTLFLDNFLVPLVTDTGARIYELFVARMGASELTPYAEAIMSEIPDQNKGAVAQAIFDFLNPGDIEVARYIFSFLDAYFVVTASGLSAKTARKLSELRASPVDFVIFVDTNFVFSILGLHSNPLNETATDLMALARLVTPDVNVRFVISPITLREAQNAIKRYRTQLGNFSYTTNLAEVATNSDEISGIYRTFFERVKASGRQISPDDYFGPYETNLVGILEGKDVTLLDIGKSIRYNGISRAESRRAETWSQPRQHRMRIASRVRRC